jgi:hypothetical protein
MSSRRAVAPDPNPQPTAAPDPLDHLLTMPSIKIDLTAQQPDGSNSSTEIDIDSTGNMQVKYSLPGVDAKLLPKGVDPKTMQTSSELFILSGKAYQPTDQDPNWMAAPFDEDYLPKLSQTLHGPDGPGLWLDMLPDGSVSSVGKDSVGGFETNKYSVNGKVGGPTITGMLWFEPQADALVQSQLNVPAAMVSDPSKPQSGELKYHSALRKPISLP